MKPGYLYLSLCCTLPLSSDFVAVQQPKPVMTLTGHGHVVYSLAISPEGKTLVSLGAESVRFWDLATGKEIACRKVTPSLGSSVAYSRDGSYVVGGLKQSVKVWDAKTRKEVFTRKRDLLTAPFRPYFTPDGKLLALPSMDGIDFWEVRTWKRIYALKPDFWPWRLAFSPDGTQLAIGGFGIGARNVEIWNIKAKTTQAVLPGTRKTVRFMNFTPDGKQLVIASTDRTRRNANELCIWQLGKKMATTATKRLQEGGFQCLAVSPDDKLLAGCETKSREFRPAGWLKLYDLKTLKEIVTITEYRVAPVYSVAFTPDGKYLLASEGRKIKIWEVASLLKKKE